MTSAHSQDLRWQDYVIAFGSLDDPSEDLWTAGANAAAGRCSMYMLGVGFDPRALVGLQNFLALEHTLNPVIGLIELPPPSSISGHAARDLADDNRESFLRMTEAYEVRCVHHRSVHTPSNAGTRVAREATKKEFVEGIGHLVVDISSLPSSLYFPILAAALTSIDRKVINFPEQLQVVACENPRVDAVISELEISRAAFVRGFNGRLKYESEPRGTVVWAPVVGERSSPEFSKIHEFLNPDDIFPVLPFPSRNPRRGDQLLLEHQVELLDAFRTSMENIIYADERNPFDVYRTLSRLNADLHLALAGLGSTTLAVSSHSSKVLSLGVLLAAYEHELPIVSALPLDYELVDSDLPALASGHQLTSAWLTGLPYVEA